MLYKKYNFFFLHMARLLLLFISIAFTINSYGQCPPNIDFEDGTFNGWKTWTGNVRVVAGKNVVSLVQDANPVPLRHEMLTSYPGNGYDQYGQFPKNCPNGSGHSIQLGNNTGGAQAEGVSYRFTIPANQNKFSLIYYYAVVFQDPGHNPEQQPKLEIEIKNLTDNSTIGCSSFSFIASGSLPGFYESPTRVNNIPVWCKDWSATSINLDGNAGKTIELFFKSADCTLGSHFGYAYVDVNIECSSSFIGATFCPGDTALNITAPYGYQSYTWYNTAFTQVLGTQQVLHLSPAPTSGSTISVELIPFSGYGCKDTLYAQLLDTLTITANAGADKLSCTNSPVQIGEPPRQGFIYKWAPTTGLSDPNISNPIASPLVTTKYVLTVLHDGGGCMDTDTVNVDIGNINNALEVIGNTAYCNGSGPNTILQVNNTDSIQWYKDGAAIPGAVQTRYIVTQTGSYHAMLFTNNGCSKSTANRQIDIYPIPDAGFTVNNASQCFPGHNFIFTNTSSMVSGNLQYQWDPGDGTIINTKDVTYNYTKPGIYTAKLFVTGDGGCIDSASTQVSVYANPVAAFTVKPVCVNLNVPLLNSTKNNTTSSINYFWDFGNGQTSTLMNPLYSYPTTGTYTIKLTVSTVQCPANFNTKEATVLIDAALPGIQYPVKEAVINFPLKLEARSFGNAILWSPAKNLDNPRSFTPVFNGNADQQYSIEIKTVSGCITIDTQMVKTIKRIGIFVPSTFTPNSDGLNDHLRPLLMGFKKVNYFRIYNRWGQLLFESNSEKPGWDGRVKGIPQDMQAVVWIIEAEDVDGIIHRQQGSAIIMR